MTEATDLFAAFKAEAGEHLATAEQALLRLSHSGTDLSEHIGEIFRAVHTVKGSAGYIQNTAILKLTHSLESVLEIFRRPPETRPDEDHIDIFFRTLDVLKSLVDDSESASDQDVSPLVQALDALYEELGNELPPLSSPQAGTVQSDEVFTAIAQQQLIALNAALAPVTRGTVIPQVATEMFIRAGETLTKAASYIGHEAVEKAARLLANWAGQHTETVITQIDLTEMSQIVADLVTQIELVLAPQKTQPKAAPKLSPAAKTNYIRVDRRHLDAFMNLVGELIVTRNSFEHLFGELTGSPPKREPALKELRTSFGTLHQISERMQDRVMDMKLIPVDGLFLKFPKLVRDLSRQLGKQVEVVMTGVETRIDRSIAEELSDPLLHLVRNAVDHGLESPSQRLELGKTEAARVYLSARQEHQDIVIEVADNGAGIDLARVRAKAVDRNLLSASAASGLSDEEAVALIFQPGFSTAAQVSDISGRGVGLDVVKRNIETLNGRVSVTSELGQGTTIRLVVPMTMAVMNAILVNAHHQLYALPVSAVSEAVRIQPSQIHQIASGQAFTLRNQVMGLRRLSDLLGATAQPQADASAPITALILTTAHGRLALAVDSIQRKEDIVVKPLQQEAFGSSLLMGASVLGDGRAILILDPTALVRLTGVSSPASPHQRRMATHG